jgi:N-acetylmuramoyl-L-alanine amidase CwlA
LPLNEIGWHSGDLRNLISIGIGVIPKNNIGEFGQNTINTLKDLISHIRKETGISLELERHFDGVQKKDCPRFYTNVTNLADIDHRVENPVGGQERWENLRANLNTGN